MSAVSRGVLMLDVIDNLYGMIAGDVRKKRFVELYNATVNGNVTFLQNYLFEYQDDDLVLMDRAALLHSLILEPEAFHAPSATFKVLTKNFDIKEYFDLHGDGPEGLSGSLWNMYAKSPRPEVAEISTVLLAEHLRYKIILDFGHQEDIVAVIGKNASSLTEQHERMHLVNAIKLVQNSLVDYVGTLGPKMIAHSGAAFLNIMKDDVDSKLWTKKITSISANPVYHAKEGEGIKISMTFDAS